MDAHASPLFSPGPESAWPRNAGQDPRHACQGISTGAEACACIYLDMRCTICRTIPSWGHNTGTFSSGCQIPSTPPPNLACASHQQKNSGLPRLTGHIDANKQKKNSALANFVRPQNLPSPASHEVIIPRISLLFARMRFVWLFQ